MKKTLALTALGLFTLAMAHASIIPTFVTMSNLGGGVYAYNYDVSVESPGERVQFATTPGVGGNPAGGYDNHFTFFDFFGYVPGSASCSGSTYCGDFTVSVSSTGPSAYHQAPDDGSAVNITWTDTAAGVVIPTGAYLGRFTMNSTSGNPSSIEFVGQSTKNGGNQDGTVTGNFVNTVGPSNVPEPATLALLGAGLIGLGMLRKRIVKA